MREIKFRGFSKELNKWFFGSLDNTLNWADFIITPEQGIGIKNRIESETIGQFTGLKDKNGTDIYEGDILLEKSILVNIDKNKEVPHSSHINLYEVFWSVEYCSWSLKKIKTTRPGNFGLGNIDSFKISIKTEGSEVIGNIYEK